MEFFPQIHCEANEKDGREPYPKKHFVERLAQASDVCELKRRAAHVPE